ncbi:cellulose synthase operon protein YhjQ/BcsQ, partial [Enterobacter hormaechei]
LLQILKRRSDAIYLTEMDAFIARRISLASKQPLGEYRSDSLAAEEILTLANWCLLHFAKRPEPAGSSV